MGAPVATPVRAVSLTPFHYHSLAVPSGTATLSSYLADRSMSYALAGAMGALAASAALPQKDYRRDLEALPWLCSAFEAQNPRLLPPIGKRLNLDTEGGYQKRLMDATGTGNLKTWFYIQEVPPGVVYEGAVFGPDPFRLASEVEGRKVESLVLRTGRHLGGLIELRRAPEIEAARLNLHTAKLFGAAVEAMEVDVFALYDIQLTAPMKLAEAAAVVGSWRSFQTGASA
ncbi:hypothetical protein [Neomegalonema sp.]|uniref:hypothetical protein n=1 Tax=Neomegalonema sp. TaxID=2039713 RepID=UPI00261CF753|nr:hypothetical protein [Neomegalonema sp.]MDD2867480.1 hypothetical protein [Neomegalonema sp.]